MSPELRAAWAWAMSLIPPDEAHLVGELIAVEQSALSNIYGYTNPCAEAGVTEAWVKVADCAGCVHSRYIEQVCLHEASHRIEIELHGDASEVAAERRVAQYWPQGMDYAWQPMTQLVAAAPGGRPPVCPALRAPTEVADGVGE